MKVTIAPMMITPPPCNSIPQKVLGNYRQGGDGGTFRERFKSRHNLTCCQTWEIKCQFQEISRNGAMEERSGKGSNLDAISLHTVEYGRTHVSSRKLLAMGRWRNVPGKVQMLESHLFCGI
jgi:hypothetical protein